MRYIAPVFALLLLTAACAAGRLTREWPVESSPWASEAREPLSEVGTVAVGRKKAFVVHGVRQTAFEDVSIASFRFLDAAHTHWAYLARERGRQVVVRDAAKPVAYDDIAGLKPPRGKIGLSDGTLAPYRDYAAVDWAYTADGHLTFLARTPKGVWVVRDGEAHGPYPVIVTLLVTPHHWGFVTGDGTSWHFNLDGQIHGVYNEKITPWQIACSRDGARVIHVAVHHKHGVLIMEGGRELFRAPSPTDAVARLELSPDGTRWACLLMQRDGTHPVIDGQVLPFQLQAGNNRLQEALLRAGSVPIFSPDSKHTVFIAMSQVAPAPGEQDEEPVINNDTGVLQGLKLPAGARASVVRDGTPGPAYRCISAPHLVFSPDGAHVAYAVFLDAFQWRMVLDGREVGPVCSSLDAPIFSADGRHMAYTATVDGTRCLVRDGVATPLQPGMQSRSLRLSSDGAHAWYTVEKDYLSVLVIDGVVQLKGYHMNSDPIFLAGHVLYLGRIIFASGAPARDTLVVDGTPTLVGDTSGLLVPDGPASFHYFVRRIVDGAPKLFAVQETVSGKP
jgi:hypothetical protein